MLPSYGHPETAAVSRLRLGLLGAGAGGAHQRYYKDKVGALEHFRHRRQMTSRGGQNKRAAIVKMGKACILIQLTWVM